MFKLSENLQILRKEKKLTQEQVAEVFGVTPQSVSKWEQSISCPDITLLPKLAEFYQVSIDELLGYKPITSINNIYIQIHSFLSSIEDDGELIDAIYRITRLTGACTSKHESDTIDKLLDGKHTNNASMLQTYGKEYGGVLAHDINSMFVSSFKNYGEIKISQLREIYRTLNRYTDIKVLKVLNTMFEHSNETFIHDGITIKAIMEKTNLTEDEVYKAMNNLDVKLNSDTKEEKWFLTHVDTLPLLVLLNTVHNFFKGE